MLEYYTAAIGFIFILLYVLINNRNIAGRLFVAALKRDGTKKDRCRLYLERFREQKQSRTSRSIVMQILPWLVVLALVYILSNQYVYFGTVLTGSMQPVFKRGDLVLMQTVDKRAEVGEIIMFSVFGVNEPITHRVIRIENGYIITKGDANPGEDGWRLNKENIMGKAVAIGGQPVKITGLGSLLVPEAGEFSILSKLPKGMEVTILFQQFRALQPFIIFFATIFYFFVLIETRIEYNSKYTNGRNGLRDRIRAPRNR